MASKKWMIATGVVAVIGAGLVLLGIAGNKMVHEGFKKALVATGSGATGASFTIGESDLNIFTGQGSVKSIIISGVPGEAAEPVFEIHDAAFEVKPFSLIYGTIDIASLTVGELKVAATVSAGTSNVNKILVSALAFSKLEGGEYSDVRLVVRKLTILKGDMTASVNIFGGKPFTKSISLPPINMTTIGGSKDGASPAVIAYDILKEVGSSVINKALKNL
ncbi:MAG: hypothetical protein V7750_19245 [Sneathiella sp.]